MPFITLTDRNASELQIKAGAEKIIVNSDQIVFLRVMPILQGVQYVGNYTKVATVVGHHEVTETCDKIKEMIKNQI